MLKLFRIFKGCFTVQLSRFFAVVLISSNFYIISLLFKFVNNFFIYFSIFRLKLCLSYCLSQTASLYYHPLRFLSTAFFTFFDIFCILFSGIIFFPYNTYSTADFSLASSSGVFFPHNTCLTTQSQLYRYPDACEISLTFISTDIGIFSNF